MSDAVIHPKVHHLTLKTTRLQEMVVARQVAALKSRVQRINPIENADEHSRLWGELVALEMHRIRLRERAIGGL